MNKTLADDIVEITNRDNYDFLRNRTVLISGATGFLGSIIARTIVFLNNNYHYDTRLILIYRTRKKIPEDLKNLKNVKWIESDLSSQLVIDDEIDYIIHAASPTRSKFFVSNPVETLDIIANGTKTMLEFAKTKDIRKFLLVSSMEAYGTLMKTDVDESDQGYIDLMSSRSSYSFGKRTAELYSYLYYKEYGVPTSIARLAMCFGAGLPSDDNRAHKSFCESAIAGNDIVLRSNGETRINFIYSVDAICAIFSILRDGKDGEMYNVAADNPNCTIKDMAQYIANLGDVNVRIDTVGDTCFAPVNGMIMDNKKIKKIGWKPKYQFNDAIDRLYKSLSERQ